MTRPPLRLPGSAAIALPAFVISLVRLGAVDLAYLLRAGAEMIHNRSVMQVDSFTFTAAGAAWLNQQWLAEIILAATLSVGGWLGLALLRAGLVAVTAWGILRACLARGADQRQAVWLTLAAMALALPAMNLRPQLFGVACFALSLWLVSERDGPAGRVAWLVPLAAAWANLHGTFPLLFVIGGAALLEDIRREPPRARRLVMTGVAALVATLLNPFGGRVWMYVAGLASNDAVRTTVAEWEPPSLASWSGAAFLLSIPVVAWFLARTRPRPPVPWLFALAAFLVLGLGSTRGTLWWALVMPVVVAAGFGARQGAGARRPEMVDVRVPLPLLLLVVLAPLARWLPYYRSEPAPYHLIAQAPGEVVEALRDHLRDGDRVFSSQVWGSWMEFSLPANPVVVDSRIELFPDSVWEQYRAVATGAPGWAGQLDQWNVKAVALAAEQHPPLLEIIRQDTLWRPVFVSDVGAVYVRP